MRRKKRDRRGDVLSSGRERELGGESVVDRRADETVLNREAADVVVQRLSRAAIERILNDEPLVGWLICLSPKPADRYSTPDVSRGFCLFIVSLVRRPHARTGTAARR